MQEEIITNEELIVILESAVLDAMDDFMERTGEEIELDEERYEMIYAIAVIILFGYLALKKDKTVSESIKNKILPSFDDNYKGVRETTKKQLKALKKDLGENFKPRDLREFRNRRLLEITEPAQRFAENRVIDSYAQDTGRNIIGIITMNDGRVRTEKEAPVSHVKYHYRYYRNGQAHDPTEDPNCRCTKLYYKSIEDARENGFEPL